MTNASQLYNFVALLRCNSPPQPFAQLHHASLQFLDEQPAQRSQWWTAPDQNEVAKLNQADTTGTELVICKNGWMYKIVWKIISYKCFWILHSVYDNVVSFMWSTLLVSNVILRLGDLLYPSGLSPDFSSGNKCTSTACRDECRPSKSDQSLLDPYIYTYQYGVKLPMHIFVILCISLLMLPCKNLVLHVPIARPQKPVLPPTSSWHFGQLCLQPLRCC